MSDRSERWRIKPGEKLDLSAIDTSSTEGAPGDGDKARTKATFKDLRKELRGWQERLYAEDERSLLVVLQAMDGGGKDGTIKHVFRGVNAVGVKVASFKQPNEVELSHDFLWRVHQNVPHHGQIGVFNRSHYEDVLVVRVHELVSQKVWRERYDHIRNFEHLLETEANTRVVKLFLHISEDEQKRRFQRRLDRPDKRWKFNKSDLREREMWDDYQAAFHDAIVETTTELAPWYVVPADHKWYRNWAVSQILLDTLEEMKPDYPEPEDLDGVEIK